MRRNAEEPPFLTIVAGQGEIGGGEQMLLRISTGAQRLGWGVRVLGPSWGDLGEACSKLGFDYVALLGSSRRAYGLAAARYLTRRDLGLVWANGGFAALISTCTPNPLVVHFHQTPRASQALALKAALTRARAVLVPSEFMLTTVGRAEVLVNWTADYDFVERRPDRDVFTVTYLGRLSQDKGVDTLARAVSALTRNPGSKPVRLVVAGDSRFVPPESSAAVMAALHSCSAPVEFAGWADPTEMLAASNVVVVPSLWAEPFGLVAAEAMAAGCPLVVSNAGALPEVVGPNHPWVFPRGDATALASLLEEVRRGDTAVAVAAQRRRWETYFSPGAGEERLARLLTRLKE